MKIYTFPTTEQLEEASNRTPEYMRPNTQPYAVVFDKFLSDSECDAIIEEQSKIESYKFPHCDASTTECEYPLTQDLWPILEAINTANEACFEYDISLASGRAWMQSYEPGGSYQRHMDGAPGQSRKLTGVAMLTDNNTYSGGYLHLDVAPNPLQAVIDDRGTVVVFPGWLIHSVSALKIGTRQTINLGVWGPPWR